jgi:hypothetical protein
VNLVNFLSGIVYTPTQGDLDLPGDAACSAGDLAVLRLNHGLAMVPVFRSSQAPGGIYGHEHLYQLLVLKYLTS